MKAALRRVLLPALAIAGLNACGGGGGGSLFAGGGISGTGTGTITGFGSVIINDIREFRIDANTRILWDGKPITEAQLAQRGTGSVVRVDVGTDVSADFTSGTAVDIYIGNLVKGPVTGTSPLQVLGQNIVLTADTAYFEDDVSVPAFGVGLNTPVEVNGFPDANGTILVSRIERVVTSSLPAWKIIGKVTAVAASGTFTIGIQDVAPGTLVPRNCTGNAVGTGDLVKVEAAVDPLFTPGAILTTVTAVECLTPGLAIPANATGTALKAETEGLVDSINLPQLTINGQTVITTVGTVFEGGTAGDIDIGTKLEAAGDLDTTSGILTADSIRFRDRRVRIEAPADLPLGGSFPILGVITVNTSTLTEDNDGLISGGTGNQQVEVRGYLDAGNQVIATEVRDRGTADWTRVRLRGPVGLDTCAPPGDVEFDILGVTVDTATALAFFDLDGSMLTQDAFCTRATTGTFVQAEDGEFFSGPVRIENADLIGIED